MGALHVGNSICLLEELQQWLYSKDGLDLSKPDSESVADKAVSGVEGSGLTSLKPLRFMGIIGCHKMFYRSPSESRSPVLGFAEEPWVYSFAESRESAREILGHLRALAF